MVNLCRMCWIYTCIYSVRGSNLRPHDNSVFFISKECFHPYFLVFLFTAALIWFIIFDHIIICLFNSFHSISIISRYYNILIWLREYRYNYLFLWFQLSIQMKVYCVRVETLKDGMAPELIKGSQQKVRTDEEKDGEL